MTSYLTIYHLHQSRKKERYTLKIQNEQVCRVRTLSSHLGSDISIDLNSVSKTTTQNKTYEMFLKCKLVFRLL